VKNEENALVPVIFGAPQYMQSLIVGYTEAYIEAVNHVDRRCKLCIGPSRVGGTSAYTPEIIARTDHL